MGFARLEVALMIVARYLAAWPTDVGAYPFSDTFGVPDEANTKGSVTSTGHARFVPGHHDY